MGYIYKITNVITNKIYIGQTIRPYIIRWKEYFQESKKSAISSDLKIYGKENFKFEVLEEIENSFLNEREKYWISYYNSYYDGYNQTKGGGRICDPSLKKTPQPILTTRQRYYCFENQKSYATLSQVYNILDEKEKAKVKFETFKRVVIKICKERKGKSYKGFHFCYYKDKDTIKLKGVSKYQVLFIEHQKIFNSLNKCVEYLKTTNLIKNTSDHAIYVGIQNNCSGKTKSYKKSYFVI